ncbi:FAD-dependent oxidoreductase [Luteolibacter arcticus]|uniref:FAD-dependent oxidoreductase n=1 Tax=Luteolibacter arcticus TaxID=1581411 RepID=UPI0029CAB3D1|nr:FAD-dependent oxidoreductase [Luteolibacter arcticus]
MTADVLVLGAGSAGLAAAVTAARAGARVILVERYGFAGGMGTASLVHTFCGLYLLGDGAPVIANAGFPSEMAERMLRATGESGPVKMGRVWVLRQHPVEFVRIADELLRESGVEVLFHTEALDAAHEGDSWVVDAMCRGQRRELWAKALIDASGDAVLADLLGAGSEMTESSRLQRPAYVFGVQGAAGGEEGLALAGRIVDGVRRGLLSKETLGLHFRASGRAGEIFGTIDLSGAEEGDYNPLDVACLSRLEVTGRSVAAAAVDFLRKEAAGWGGACISQWPVRAGVRESRRWKGRHVLTEVEVLGGVRHEDDIALATWPLEFRETNRGPKLRYPENDQAAGIPLGCLMPEALDGVFVAGRCISCDHGAQASVRVMGTCFATGQAAGLAAALVAKGETDGLAQAIRRQFPFGV